MLPSNTCSLRMPLLPIYFYAWLADNEFITEGLEQCHTMTNNILYHLYNPVFFNLFFQVEPFAAILIAHGTHGHVSFRRGEGEQSRKLPQLGSEQN